MLGQFPKVTTATTPRRQSSPADVAGDGELRAFLTGGDRRSIARSDRARALVEGSPALVTEVASLCSDEDWLVALRALDCARENGWTAFARICGDRPFFEPADTDRAIACMADAASAIDLVSSTLAGSIPPGLTTEVVRTDALERAVTRTSDPRDLEHVTRYFYAHPGQFGMVGLAVRGAGEKLRLAVKLGGGWVVIHELTENQCVTDEDVKLMLRREGYSGKSGLGRLSDMQSFRLWCLEHRRLGYC